MGNQEENKGLSDLLIAVSEVCELSSDKDPVRKFKRALVEAGVEIKEYPPAKYFAAGMGGDPMILLAHESTEVGWWGILKDIIDRVIGLETVKTHKVGWGAALLDKDYKRGYWISGENIFALKTLCLVSLGKEAQYHFKHENLRKKPGLAPYFYSIEEFLSVSGLKSK